MDEPLTGPREPTADASAETSGSDPTAGMRETTHQARPLTAREVEMLAFEQQWWKFAGAKDQAIRESFDMSSTRYYQVLNTLIDRPEALEREPMLVGRLRRTRAARRRTGSARSVDALG